jgi:hypothetical protein
MCLFSSCPKNICPMSIVHQLVIWLTLSFVCPSDLGMSSCPMLSWPYFGFLSNTIDNAFYQNGKFTLSVSFSCGTVLCFSLYVHLAPTLTTQCLIGTCSMAKHKHFRGCKVTSDTNIMKPRVVRILFDLHS